MLHSKAEHRATLSSALANDTLASSASPTLAQSARGASSTTWCSRTVGFGSSARRGLNLVLTLVVYYSFLSSSSYHRVDTAAAKFTLPDFCRDKGQFTTLLQYSLDPATGRPRFTALSKDQAFEQYYSRRTGGDTSGSGYEPLG